MRNECNIIRDILPLYVEDMVNEDTASFVEEHLENCAECRKIAAKMKEPAGTADLQGSGMTSYANEAAPLKLVKRKLRRKQLLTMLLSFVAAAALIWGMVSALFIWGVPISSEGIKVETEIQYSETGYLNQVFALHIIQMSNKSLRAEVNSVYKTDEKGKYVYDEYGHTILIGYEIIVREIPFGNNPNNFTIGYEYDGETIPDDDFDFTFTIKFKDTVVVYSVVEEGLFVPQSDMSQ